MTKGADVAVSDRNIHPDALNALIEIVCVPLVQLRCSGECYFGYRASTPGPELLAWHSALQCPVSAMHDQADATQRTSTHPLIPPV
jgi:hypothetical protein